MAGTAPPRTRVAISFGSPAGESGVTRLDLNEILIQHPQAAFLMRVSGAAMRDAGIDDGDLALVDKAIDPVHGHTVIAVVGEEFVCRRLHKQGGDVRLRVPAGSGVDLVADEGENFQVWGVVTHVIKAMAV